MCTIATDFHIYTYVCKVQVACKYKRYLTKGYLHNLSYSFKDEQEDFKWIYATFHTEEHSVHSFGSVLSVWQHKGNKW